jgi:hypothetical protein
MAQGQDSTKSAAASNEASEGGRTAAEKRSKQRIERLADEMAERANNTINAYEDTAPAQQRFTK